MNRWVSTRNLKQQPAAAPAPEPAAARPTGERIPLALQTVFLQSNRGKEVHKPPPKRVADRTFFRNWFFRWGSTKNTTKKTYNSSKDKVLTKEEKPPSVREIKPDIEQPALPPVAERTDVDNATLQEYFDALLEERGYGGVKLFETLKTGYYYKASQLQIASYGPRMVQIVKSSDARALRETLSGGLSPNPCNQFGESLLHMICRRGDVELLDVMIEAGTTLQVSDDFGRTPLHDACWAAKPAFEVVKRLLDRDAGMLFLKDKRGSLPFSYVHKADWHAWRDWLDENMDTYFPESALGAAASKAEAAEPELARLGPNSVALPEQKVTGGLPLELIQMVANGDLSPREARAVAETSEADPTETELDFSDSEDSDIDDDSDYDDSDSDYDSDLDSETEFDEMEEAEMMEMLQIARGF